LKSQSGVVLSGFGSGDFSRMAPASPARGVWNGFPERSGSSSAPLGRTPERVEAKTSYAADGEGEIVLRDGRNDEFFAVVHLQ
jgi:hypothetical protein